MKFAYSMRCGKINAPPPPMQNKRLMLTALAVLMATVISSCDSNSLSTSANSNAMANEKEWKVIEMALKVLQEEAGNNK